MERLDSESKAALRAFSEGLGAWIRKGRDNPAFWDMTADSIRQKTAEDPTRLLSDPLWVAPLEGEA
mgnify:CR=1 FL=1